MKKEAEDKTLESSELDETITESFEERKKLFDKYYTWVVIMCLATALAAVAVAIYLHFLIGILMFIAVPIIYVVFVGDKLEKSLGLSYKTTDSGVSVAVIKRGKNVLDTDAYVPEKLFWYNVTAIHGGKKSKSEENVSTLHIPTSIKLIEEDAFAGIISLNTIRYCGTRDQWNGMDCRADVSALEIICCDDAPRECAVETE